MEMLGFSLIYLLVDILPWESVKGKSKELKGNIDGMELKSTIGGKTRDLPIQFKLYLKYCRQLKFDEEPDYDYLCSLFEKVIKNEGGTVVKQAKNTGKEKVKSGYSRSFSNPEKKVVKKQILKKKAVKKAVKKPEKKPVKQIAKKKAVKPVKMRRK